MANTGNNPACEEEIVAEECHSEEQEIQVDDASEGNNVEREYVSDDLLNHHRRRRAFSSPPCEDTILRQLYHAEVLAALIFLPGGSLHLRAACHY